MSGLSDTELSSISHSLYGHEGMTVYRQVIACRREFPTLSPIVENFNFNDGRQERMICLKGTVNMYFRGETYNAPVKIFLPKTFPNSSPFVYIDPARNMRVSDKVANYRFDGLVMHEYLDRWNRMNSHLVGLIEMLSMLFSQHAPVFQVSAAEQQPPPPQQQQQQYNFGRSYSNSTSSSNHQHQDIDEDAQMQAIILQSLKTRGAELVEKRLLEEEVVRGKAMDDLITEAQTLSFGTSTIVDMMEKLDDDINTTREQRNELQRMKAEADRSLETASSGDVNWDDAVRGRTPVETQLIRLVAEDSAMKDTIDKLRDLFEKEIIELEEFLKEVRKIAREQFRIRMLINKTQHVIVGM
eukprot:m.10098 g.10098  ORF g.10098 m.10098 type:complete len:355 (-) comp6509_c0_seq1:78-1142(-)